MLDFPRSNSVAQKFACNFRNSELDSTKDYV